jgi:hypothetical protein
VTEAKIKEDQRSRESDKAEIFGLMDRRLVQEGRLVIIDRKPTKSWSKRLAWNTEAVEAGQTIRVAGCRRVWRQAFGRQGERRSPGGRMKSL